MTVDVDVDTPDVAVVIVGGMSKDKVSWVLIYHSIIQENNHIGIKYGLPAVTVIGPAMELGKLEL